MLAPYLFIIFTMELFTEAYIVVFCVLSGVLPTSMKGEIMLLKVPTAIRLELNYHKVNLLFKGNLFQSS